MLILVASKSAAEFLGLLLAIFIAFRAIRYLFYARVSIDFLGQGAESFFHTPAAINNRNITTSGYRQLSYSKFRLKLRLSASRPIELHGATLYARHRDMARQWAELSPVTLPISENETNIFEDIQDFARRNARPYVNESIVLDNGSESYSETLGAGENREMTIARLGGFILPLPQQSRKINGADYCDILLRLNINAVAAVFLYAVPAYNSHDAHGPILLDSRTFAGARTFDVLTWASKVRPNAGAEGQYRGTKFWVRLRT